MWLAYRPAVHLPSHSPAVLAPSDSSAPVFPCSGFKSPSLLTLDLALRDGANLRFLFSREERGKEEVWETGTCRLQPSAGSSDIWSILADIGLVLCSGSWERDLDILRAYGMGA